MTGEQSHISLSLIIPVWNTPLSFLDECLRPFRGPICDNRVELIIVDDGSNLAVASYLDSQTFSIPAIIVHQNNSGQSVARQVGIQRARGDYLGFLDSDDYIDVNAFYDIIDIVIGSHADIIAFRGKRVDTEGKRAIGDIGWRTGCSLKREYIRNCAELWLQFIRRKFYLEQIHPFMHNGVCIGEDLAIILPLVIRAESIEYLDIDLYRYRQQESSVLHSMDFISRMKILNIFEYIFLELTDDEFNLYHDEIEWQVINHLLNYETRVQLKDGAEGLLRAKTLGSWVDKRFKGWRHNPFIKEELKRQGVALRLSLQRCLRTILVYQYIRKLLTGDGDGN